MQGSQMKIKIPKWILGIVVILALIGSFASGYYVAPRSNPLKPMLLRLDFPVSGYHVGPFVALDQGYYRDQGIDLTIGGGRGSEQTVLEVATGTAQFGFANLDQLIDARKLGYDLVMTGMFFNRPPYGFSYRTADALTTPQSLIGKTVTASAGNEEYIRKWFAANGIDMDKQVHYVTMDWGVGLSQLLVDQIDALFSYYGSLYTLAWLQGQVQNVPMSFQFMGDSQWAVYGSGFCVSRSLIQSDPKLVEGFMRATWMGYDYYAKHPQDAINILLKYHPEINDTQAKVGASQSLELAMVPETLQHGYGYMLENKVATTIQLLGENMKASDVYTNDYVFSDLKPPTTAPPV